MIEYTWSITDVERDLQTGGITTIHWRYLAREDNFFSEKYQLLEVKPNPENSDFIPFENVTEAHVIAWLESALADKIPKMQEELAADIQEKKSKPVLVTGVPWA